MSNGRKLSEAIGDLAEKRLDELRKRLEDGRTDWTKEDVEFLMMIIEALRGSPQIKDESYGSTRDDLRRHGIEWG